jgi:transposase
VWRGCTKKRSGRSAARSTYVVLDNLKQGVIRPDLYESELNPLYAALLAHYGVVADPARVGDPDRKGTVENAIQHTQGTALNSRRFDSLEAQNEHRAHWEERWARSASMGARNAKCLQCSPRSGRS